MIYSGKKMDNTIKRVNDFTYANETFTMIRFQFSTWELYKSGEKVDNDMFRWDLAERNNLVLVED